MGALRTAAIAARMLAGSSVRQWLYWASRPFSRVDLMPRSTSRLGLPESRGHEYCDSGGPDLARALRALGVGHGENALDLGCGKGGAMIVLAAMDFARVDGVEYSPEVAAIARANLARAGVRSSVVHEGDAGRFEALDDYGFCYMYNPFPAAVVEEVMQNLTRSLARRPRRLELAYKNPVCHDEVMASGLFRVQDEVMHDTHPCRLYVHEPTDAGAR